MMYRRIFGLSRVGMGGRGVAFSINLEIEDVDRD